MEGMFLLKIMVIPIAIIIVLIATFLYPSNLPSSFPQNVPAKYGQEFDIGQQISLTANMFSSGSGGEQFQWYNSSNLIPGQTNFTYQAIAGKTGTFHYSLVYTNRKGQNSTLYFNVTVNPKLSAGIPTFYMSGKNITLKANVSGGTPPYVYQWTSGSSPNCSTDLAPLGPIFLQIEPSTYTIKSSSNTYYCYAVGDFPKTQASMIIVSSAAISPTISPST
jgi:hypothetical protein